MNREVNKIEPSFRKIKDRIWITRCYNEDDTIGGLIGRRCKAWTHGQGGAKTVAAEQYASHSRNLTPLLLHYILWRFRCRVIAKGGSFVLLLV